MGQMHTMPIQMLVLPTLDGTSNIMVKQHEGWLNARHLRPEALLIRHFGRTSNWHVDPRPIWCLAQDLVHLRTPRCTSSAHKQPILACSCPINPQSRNTEFQQKHA